MSDNQLKSKFYPTKRKRTNGAYASVLFVDPGLGGTGLAHWKEFQTKPRAPVEPTGHAVLRAKKVLWQSAVDDYVLQFRGYIIGWKPQTVVIEWPEVWSDSGKSMASATKGDLGKLYFLIGGFAEACRRLVPCEPLLIAPREWKGQLPKEVVLDRVEKRLGFRPRDHEGDAIGMGMAAMGFL